MYAKDIEKYEKERGLYYDLNILPFPLATNNDELEKNILSFDKDKYEKELIEYLESEGLKEKGNAKETITKIILEYINNNVKYN